MDLACLRRHLKGQSLPDGWIQCPHSTTEDTLVFAKLSVNLPLLFADAEFLLKVDEGLKWSLSCRSILVEVGQCQVFTGVASKITSARALLDILLTLQASQVCCGNAVSDFQSLVDAHGAEFKDSTGIIMQHIDYMTCMHACMYRCQEGSQCGLP